MFELTSVKLSVQFSAKISWDFPTQDVCRQRRGWFKRAMAWNSNGSAPARGQIFIHTLASLGLPSVVVMVIDCCHGTAQVRLTSRRINDACLSSSSPPSVTTQHQWGAIRYWLITTIFIFIYFTYLVLHLTTLDDVKTCFKMFYAKTCGNKFKNSL